MFSGKKVKRKNMNHISKRKVFMGIPDKIADGPKNSPINVALAKTWELKFAECSGFWLAQIGPIQFWRWKL